MQPPSVTLYKKEFWIFLVGLAVLVMILGGVVTSRYGAGVASDSVKYLAVAQNLLDGKGLIDHRGSPLIAWPPLYSMFLAGLSFISGLDVFVAGWYFNIFLLGLNVVLSGVIFQHVFFAKPLYAYLSSLFVALSISSLRIHVVVLSDAFYLTLTLLFLIAADGYIQKRSRYAFAWMVLLSALAPLLRYVGLAFVVTGSLIILIENRKSFPALFRDGFVLGLISIAPIFWWLIIHNVITYGSLWGTSNDQMISPIQNVGLGLTKMLHWFVPYLTPLMPVLTRPLILLAVVVVILYLLNRRRGDLGLTWARTLTSRSAYPSLIYGAVYFAAVVITSVTGDHRWLDSDDRYYVIILAPVLLLLVLSFDNLILPHIKISASQSNLALILIFACWSIYPLYSIREYMANTLTMGESSGYNIFNTRAYHEMKIVSEMKRLSAYHPNEIVYSNYSDAVWFYTRRPVSILPMRGVPDLKAAYIGWPHAKPGYIVWFKPNEYKHYLSPEELAQFASLKLIYTDPSGDIYYVWSR